MKRSEVLKLEQNLRSGILDDLRGAKFLYALNKNMQAINAEADSIRKAGQPSKEYELYDKERIAINEKHSVKNPDGTPKMENRTENTMSFVIDEKSKKKYDADMTVLNKTYAQVIAERTKEIKNFNENFLMEESDYLPYFIDSSDLPDDMTWKQTKMISPLIKKQEDEHK